MARWSVFAKKLKERGRRLGENSKGFHVHKNGGGGWVQDTAKVDDTAFVGEYCLVLGKAKVLDFASLENKAVVIDHAVIKDHAKVLNFATIEGKAIIEGNAIVQDTSMILGNAIVQDNAVVSGNSFISNSTIKGHAFVEDQQRIYHGVTISGTTYIANKEAIISHNINKTKGL